jgi:lipopolysaccharide transport system permease protein
MEYEIKPARRLSLGLAELWHYRELFYFFTWRDIKVKYKQTVIGFAWAVLQPLLMMLIFTAFFGRMVGQSLPAGMPYPVFVFAGLMLWNLFSSGLTNAGNSMVSNANIIKKIYFPRLIIPFAAVLVGVFDFVMTFAVFAALLLYYGVPLQGISLAALPLALLLAAAATVGAGSFIASLSVKYRDFRYIVPFSVQFLLFVTPVIYPASIVTHPVLHAVVQLNPMTGAIALFRAGLTGQWPDAGTLLLSAGMAAVLLVGGLFYFRKTEAYFADLA